MPLAAVIAIGFGIGAGSWFGYRFVTTSSRFAISAIEIRGAHKVAPDEIRATLPIHVGDNTFGADLDRTRRAVMANPWIASVEVDRVLPHGVIVTVHERTPIAVAALGELYLVDASGHPFKRAAIEAGEGVDLPIITGLDRAAYRDAPDVTAQTIRDALAALDAWKTNAARPAIGEVHIDDTGALVLHTYEHATAIRLGALETPAELAARMETFDAAWHELSEREREETRAIRLDTRTDHVTVSMKD